MPTKARARAPSKARAPTREADRPTEQADEELAHKAASSKQGQADGMSKSGVTSALHHLGRTRSRPAATYINNIVARPSSQFETQQDEAVADAIPAFYAEPTQPVQTEPAEAKAHGLGQSATALLSYLATGTTLTLLSSHISNQTRGQLPAVQDLAEVLALAKFSAMLAFTSGLQLLSRQPAYKPTKRTSMLMSGLGLLDVVGYATYCLGLELCGAALCTLINAAAQQLFTAILSRVLLGKKFTRLQQSSVRAVLCLGWITHRNASCLYPAGTRLEPLFWQLIRKQAL
ncbi:hypothetical protein MMC29_000504 [Sticta canariensis]|nr:hypothetical protein [Sticta canariensis]